MTSGDLQDLSLKFLKREFLNKIDFKVDTKSEVTITFNREKFNEFASELTGLADSGLDVVKAKLREWLEKEVGDLLS